MDKSSTLKLDGPNSLCTAMVALSMSACTPDIGWGLGTDGWLVIGEVCDIQAVFRLRTY